MRCPVLQRSILFCALTAIGATSVAQVTTRSLLQEMYDLERLTHRPSPAFTMAQASSYDRGSTKPGDDSWFANADAGKFLRIESRYGRKEYVMADLKGPGAVVRIWSANPSGIARIYLDGEEFPRVVADFAALLDGKLPPFRGTFAYEAGKGHDLYFPIPYEHRLKITIDDTQRPPPSLYYHVGYRTYEEGTKVESFNPRSIFSDDLDQAERALENPSVQPAPANATSETKSGTVSKGSPLELRVNGAMAVYELQAKLELPQLDPSTSWSDPKQPQMLLRNLLLTAAFDEEPCISAPLGDFFGSAPGVNKYESLPFTVRADGTMTCRFVMPFKKGAKFAIENAGDIPAAVQLTAKLMPYKFKDESYYFHSQWIVDRQPPRPIRDILLLAAKGEGMYVGDNLHIANPAPEWWGEGDEKIFVDGEAFPSTFGTGTEDYFGYAWGSTNLFNRPYHGQPNAPEPNNMGHSDVHRWHVIDPIPFRKSIDFSMEAWAWNITLTPTYAHTVYWYAKPGGTQPVAIDRALLLPPDIGVSKT